MNHFIQKVTDGDPLRTIVMWVLLVWAGGMLGWVVFTGVLLWEIVKWLAGS